MVMDMDIWLDDNQGNKIRVESQTVTTLDHAIHLLTVGWNAVSEMRNKAAREDGSHSGT